VAPVGIGTTLQISMSSQHPNAMGHLLVSLPRLGAPLSLMGCDIHINPALITDFLAFMTDGDGNFSFAVGIPDIAILQGVSLVIQATVWFEGAPINGDSASNAIMATFHCVATSPQGCTPGFWRQEHHYGSWPLVYSPAQPFSSVFEDAFPGLTLGEVVALGGGGLNALGRHTVAALLDSATLGSSYGLSQADVIAMFNAVFPGGDYETLKDQFDALNNQGCPF
jgi:hypothetical protein